MYSEIVVVLLLAYFSENVLTARFEPHQNEKVDVQPADFEKSVEKSEVSDSPPSLLPTYSKDQQGNDNQQGTSNLSKMDISSTNDNNIVIVEEIDDEEIEDEDHFNEDNSDNKKNDQIKTISTQSTPLTSTATVSNGINKVQANTQGSSSSTITEPEITSKKNDNQQAMSYLSKPEIPLPNNFSNEKEDIEDENVEYYDEEEPFEENQITINPTQNISTSRVVNNGINNVYDNTLESNTPISRIPQILENKKELTGHYDNTYDWSTNSKDLNINQPPYILDKNYQGNDFSGIPQKSNLRNQPNDNEAYHTYYQSDNIDEFEPKIYANTNKQPGLQEIENYPQNFNDNPNNEQFINENEVENNENVIYKLTNLKKLLYMLHHYTSLIFYWTINKINYLIENAEYPKN